MRVTEFVAPDGEKYRFAPHQRLALERVGQWRQLGYKLRMQYDGLPTWRDSEIAVMIMDCPQFTKIFRLERKLRDPLHPYIVNRPKAESLPEGVPSFGQDAKCGHFEAALDLAREWGCSVVAVPGADFERWFDNLANDRGITLLVV